MVVEHFEKFVKTGEETRVMIFSQYRESVYEITNILSAHKSIKAMEFVGQSFQGASSGQNTRKSVSQKEQLEVCFYY
jgi:ERCC4-related helicase